jgi:hypothetical protein
MKPDYMFMELKGSSQFKMMNMYTQVIEIFGDAKVNEYRFPYKARQSQATSQATRQATDKPQAKLRVKLRAKLQGSPTKLRTDLPPFQP